MQYRLEFTVIEKMSNQSRFALRLHNLTNQPLVDWSLSFFISRFINVDTVSCGSIKQVGSYCQLFDTPELAGNDQFYTEFSIDTAPFTLHDDGISEAFISFEKDNEDLNPIAVEVTTINLNQDPVERYSISLPETASEIIIVPKPQHLLQKNGHFIFDQNTAIETPPMLAEGAVKWLVSEIQNQFSKVTPIHIHGNIHYRQVMDLPENGYRLLIEKEDIRIEATSASGFVHATSSLIQLFPITPDRQTSYAIPMVEIEDQPYYGYRGMMLDCGRHFHSVKQIKHLLDQLARYKFNTFHWHLTDDEGWRIEIDAYPELTQIGAWRGPNEVISPQFSTISTRYGGFYSKQDIRDVVRYASDRGIMIIPEIDIPGHCRAAILSLPDLLVDPDDKSVYRSIQNYSDNVLSPALEGTYAFLTQVLEEVCELFPAPYVHIGADEVPEGVWTDSPKCRSMMAEYGYQDPRELQGHLLRFVENVLNSKGKRMMGWEEATDGEKVSNDTIIFSWKSEQAGIECIKQGFDVIMQPAQYTYLDLAQGYSADEAGVDWAGKLPLDKVYSYQPLKGILENSEQKQQILGIQTALWSELVNNQDRLEYMLYPRLLAVSEICWSAPKNRNWDDFKARLKGQLGYLDKAGINYRHCE